MTVDSILLSDGTTKVLINNQELPLINIMVAQGGVVINKATLSTADGWAYTNLGGVLTLTAPSGQVILEDTYTSETLAVLLTADETAAVLSSQSVSI
jgi:hypothetical protein